MSITFPNDTSTDTKIVAASVTSGLFALGALTVALAAPLVVSLLVGGMVPMLILSAYLLSILPALSLAAGVLVCVVVAATILTSTRQRSRKLLYSNGL